MVLLEIGLVIAAILFFVILDRYTAGCERI
jgi:hypothetical protein